MLTQWKHEDIILTQFC